VQVILHIGTDKTGSKSIQNTVFLNRDWLLSHSIYVPKIGFGKSNGHSELLTNLDSEQLEKLSKELRSATEAGYQKALLSWEGMCTSKFGKANISRLLSALNNLKIHILVYLREQAEIIQSGHLQQVKQGREFFVEIKSIENPKTLVERTRSFIFLRSRDRDYYRLLRRWEKTIPKATFSVRLFDRIQLKDGDVVSDFLDQLGVSRDRNIVHAKDNYNRSLDVESAILIESFQKIHSHKADIAMLIDVTQSVIGSQGGSTKYFLGESSVRAIRNRFKRSNLKFSKRYRGVPSDPFVLSDCWRTESISSIEARGIGLLKKVEEVSQIPTLMGVATGGTIKSMVDLYDGWSEPVEWGVWSLGAESKIRFRVYRRRIIEETGSLRLVIEGSYYGNNKETNVIVNGIDFGEQELLRGNCRLTIPIDALFANELVEITLKHKHPTRPSDFEGKRDNRPLAYAVQKIGYILIKKHEQGSIKRSAEISLP
jgi:hypothetical protein